MSGEYEEGYISVTDEHDEVYRQLVEIVNKSSKNIGISETLAVLASTLGTVMQQIITDRGTPEMYVRQVVDQYISNAMFASGEAEEKVRLN